MLLPRWHSVVMGSDRLGGVGEYFQAQDGLIRVQFHCQEHLYCPDNDRVIKFCDFVTVVGQEFLCDGDDHVRITDGKTPSDSLRRRKPDTWKLRLGYQPWE